jgi:DNA polymerase-3 subunit epsilon
MTRLLVIDTETSGLDPARHSVLALAAVVWDDGRITGSFETHVWEPEMEVDPESLAINQIDLQWLQREGHSPAAAVGAFEAFLDKAFPATKNNEKVRLVGHNLGFDLPFLKALYAKAGCEYARRFSHRSIDTASILGALIVAGRLGLPEAGSSAAFTYFGIAPATDRRHTALGDAIATAHLLTRLVELLREPGRVPIAAVG